MALLGRILLGLEFALVGRLGILFDGFGFGLLAALVFLVFWLPVLIALLLFFVLLIAFAVLILLFVLLLFALLAFLILLVALFAFFALLILILLVLLLLLLLLLLLFECLDAFFDEVAIEAGVFVGVVDRERGLVVIEGVAPLDEGILGLGVLSLETGFTGAVKGVTETVVGALLGGGFFGKERFAVVMDGVLEVAEKLGRGGRALLKFVGGMEGVLFEGLLVSFGGVFEVARLEALPGFKRSGVGDLVCEKEGDQC